MSGNVNLRMPTLLFFTFFFVLHMSLSISIGTQWFYVASGCSQNVTSIFCGFSSETNFLINRLF